MNRLSTATVSLAVTPTVVSTFFSHYLNREPLRGKPTAHLSYDEGLALIRAFLEFASLHTVEDLQAFTAQWVPHPQWVKVKDVTISDQHSSRAADLLQEKLGEDGVRKVGGRKWWQWREPEAPLKAEWIEMRADYQERKRTGDPGNRVMLYVHGGAYFFGSVDEHRYQMQRHARKLNARVFAPKYRLAPQFPFPCGLQDCLAAYLFLLETVAPNAIILAGDSAGGGMVMSTMVVLRDCGVPLPAGAVLISPWVDLTHSFPSVAGESRMDYIPPGGFHHKPSMAWPPPNVKEMNAIREEARAIRDNRAKVAKKTKKKGESASTAADGSAPVTDTTGSDDDHRWHSNAVARMLTVEIDGKIVELKDQIQLYTTNELLTHPLVSPVLQPTLGGLPPILIMVGGAEALRDEQIFLAHKCANPAKYAPPDDALSEEAKLQLARYKPTPVHLQVWDDLCHVAPTLSFTRPAKYMYRSVAQFSAWALARAQKTAILIPDDDDMSVISSSATDYGAERTAVQSPSEPEEDGQDSTARKESAARGLAIGKAGDPLPPFRDHMIRQRVTRHGTILPLEAESELPACTLKPHDVGVVQGAPVRRWLETRRRWDGKYARAKAKTHVKLAREMAQGYFAFGDGETPPASALAGRRRGVDEAPGWRGKKKRGAGLALWSLWGSKHDKMTVSRVGKAEAVAEAEAEAGREQRRGQGWEGCAAVEGEVDGEGALRPPIGRRRATSYRSVADENQTGEAFPSWAGPNDAEEKEAAVDGSGRRGTVVENLLRERKDAEEKNRRLLGPEYAETGVAGKRPMVQGIAVPFSLGRATATSSMVTLQSEVALPVSEDGQGNALGDGLGTEAADGSEGGGYPRMREVEVG